MITWTTRDKRKIPVANLSDDHLVNICKMLKRNNFVPSDLAWACLSYSATAPDGAAMAAEAAFNLMKFTSLSDAIFDEADKRGVEF